MMKKIIITLLSAMIIVPLMSFAQLSLPKEATSLNTPQGQEMLLSSEYKNDYFKLASYFVTQQTPAYCAIASSVMVLNALGVKPPVDQTYYPLGLFTQTNIFTPSVLKFLTPGLVNYQGTTLDQATKLLKSFNVDAKSFYANQTSFDKFMTVALKALQSNNQYLIANFDRTKLGEKGSGHFSPIAAYNAKTDSFLIMEVSRYKYPPTWVKAKTLWEAMDTTDSTTKLKRGFIIISN